MNNQTVRLVGRTVALVAATCITTAAMAATAANHGAAPTVSEGDVTRLKGTFMTRGKAATFTLPSGATVSVFADTEASLLTDPQQLMLLPGRKVATYSVILRKGRVEVSLPESGSSSIAVAIGTPSDTRVVTLSGKVTVRAEGHNVTALSYSGMTTVTQGPKLMRLPSGIKRQFTGKSGFSDQPALAATSFVGGKRVWLCLRDRVGISGYSWAPVPFASGYAVTLRDQATSNVIARAQTKSPLFEAQSLQLSPGKYTLQIAAVDGDGFLSPMATAMDLAVVGVVLPPGAEIQKNDSILLGADQLISLSNAEGLTLTTADHRVNVPAGSPFGLAKQDRASILIHPPGTASPSTLTLIRRENQVTAWVGPKFVTWPMDAVDLRIDLKDARGNPLRPHIKPVMHVTIGIDPFDVAWTADGGSYRAQIPAQTGRGPWVVRLEVLDQNGVLIGRDFVEIDRTKLQPKPHNLSTSLEATADNF